MMGIRDLKINIFFACNDNIFHTFANEIMRVCQNTFDDFFQARISRISRKKEQRKSVFSV